MCNDLPFNALYITLQFGAVKMVEQLVWRDSGRKRGYGYIHMESEEAVEAVVGAGIHTVAGARLQAKRDNVRHAPLLC